MDNNSYAYSSRDKFINSLQLNDAYECQDVEMMDDESPINNPDSFGQSER